MERAELLQQQQEEEEGASTTSQPTRKEKEAHLGRSGEGEDSVTGACGGGGGYVDEDLWARLRGRREEVLPLLSDFNPFVNATFARTSLCEKLKLAVGGVTLLPLRCLGLAPVLLTCYGLTSLATIGLSDDDLKERPLAKWRRRLLAPTVKYGSRSLLFLVGYQWVKTKGQPSREAPIVISNHPSWILHEYVPSVVGKEDVKKIPLYGTYAKSIQTIFVRRSSPESRKEAAEEIYERVTTRYETLKRRTKAKQEREELKNARRKRKANTVPEEISSSSDDEQIATDNSMLHKKDAHTVSSGSLSREGNGHAEHHTGKNNVDESQATERRRKRNTADDNIWPPLFLFPEGGNSSVSSLISFKLGAFVPGVPIQPVAVQLPFKHHDVSPTPGTKKFWLLLRTLCQFHNKMKVTYLPVYYPTEEEQKDPKLYANNVRQAMADVLKAEGFEATEHSYEDVMLLHHALRRHYPLQKVLLESRKLLDHLDVMDLSKRNLTRTLDKFIDMDADRSGEVVFDRFCSVLHLPNAEVTSRLFDFFDVRGDGRINFREYITGMAVLSAVVTPRALSDLFYLFAEGAEHFTFNKVRETLKDMMGLSDDQIDGILAEFGKVETPGMVNFDEFKSWAKGNPVHIHILLSTERMSQLQGGGDHDKGKQRLKETSADASSDYSSDSDEGEKAKENEPEERELLEHNRSEDGRRPKTKKKTKKKKKKIVSDEEEDSSNNE